MPNEDTSSREIQDIPKEAHFLVICHGWAGHAFIGSVYGAALHTYTKSRVDDEDVDGNEVGNI